MNRVFYYLTVCAMAIILSACADTALLRSHQLKSATVESVLKPSVYSGTIESYVELSVRDQNGAVVLLYPYFSAGRKPPKIGVACDFKYEVLNVNGQVGSRFIENEKANVVENYYCKTDSED